MAVVTNILLLNGVIVIISLIGFQFADERMPFKIHAVFIGATILIHLTFAAIAFLLSAVMKKSRTITAASLGVVFISYILSIMSGISEDLDMLKYISVFKYVDAPELIADQALSPLYLLIMTGIILLGGVGTFLHYNRKDIAS